MQWSANKNGGFSDAPKNKLIRSVVSKGDFSYKKINVNDQHRDKDSLLKWMSQAINFRKEFREFGWGDFTVMDTGNKHVLAHYRKSDKGVAIAVHNFSGKEQTVKLKFEEPDDIVDIFGNKRYEKFDPKNRKLN